MYSFFNNNGRNRKNEGDRDDGDYAASGDYVDSREYERLEVILLKLE